MPTIRQIYFLHIKSTFLNKYLSKAQLFRLLEISNNFSNDEELTLNFDKEMQNLDFFNKAIKDIEKGKMFEYVTGEAYFDKKYFKVDKNVLIPRQETEELVSYFREYCKKIFSSYKGITIGDICTGSGCIAVSLKDGQIPRATVYGSDISKNALKIAKENSDKFNANVKFLTGDLLKPFIDKGIKLDCIISNPPYIADISTIDKRTWEQEPHLALLAEPAEYFYEEILKNASKVLKDKHLIAFEIGETMRSSLNKIAKKYFPNDSIRFIKDMDNKWRFMIMSSVDLSYFEAVEALSNHGVIAFPTETVMGLGVVYDDKIAFEKLNQIKGRPENKPYSLMLGNIRDICKYAHITPIERKIINAFLPGPLTILLKKKDLPEWVTLGSEYVGIRVPDDLAIQKILNLLGKPILAPSANRSGEAPAMNSREVKSIFKDEIDCVISGRALNGVASTIVKVDNGIEIVRQGKITKEEIEEAIKNDDCNRK